MKRRAGRKSNPNAKRRQTTREGRGYCTDLGTVELRQHRVAVAGDTRIACDFPLDIMAARFVAGKSYGLSQQLVDVGHRYASLHWAVFGLPLSCSAIYRKFTIENTSNTCMSENALIAVSRDYRSATSAIIKQGSAEVLRDLTDTVVHLEAFNFEAMTVRDHCRYSRLRQALEILDQHFHATPKARLRSCA